MTRRGLFAIVLALCFAMLAGTAQSEYVYNVTIVMNGIGIIPLETDEPPTITPSGVVIIKCDEEYYLTSIDNVVILMTKDGGDEESQEDGAELFEGATGCRT